MIPRHQRDVGWRTQFTQPLRRLQEFRWQADMSEIASNQELAKRALSQVSPERGEHLGAVFMAPFATPREVTERPLVEQLERAHLFKGSQVRI